jgi:hypothetical protein
MATVFSAPEINSAESVGVKSGGIKAFDTDVIRPVSNLIRDEFSGSKQLEFRWRSDSSRFFSPKDTKLKVEYEIVGANQDTETVVYANLSDRDDIEEVKFDTTRWFKGTVRRYNAGQQGRPGSINVGFDDGTQNVTISFYDRSVHYVEPAFIERI